MVRRFQASISFAAPRRDRRGVGRARGYFAAIGRNPIRGFGIFGADGIKSSATVVGGVGAVEVDDVVSAAGVGCCGLASSRVSTAAALPRRQTVECFRASAPAHPNRRAQQRALVSVATR